MLSFLQKEGVQGLASLFDNSAAILLLSITAEPVNKGNNNTNMDRGRYVISQSPKECEIYILKKTQILRQLIRKSTFTQRCSLIYFASVHLYCDTNDLENIYSISYWIYHFFIREDFFNEQHKTIVMGLHSSPLVGWCLFVFFFIVVLIMYIFQHFVRRSFFSLSTWRQVLLGRLPFQSYQSCFMLNQLNTFTPNEHFMDQNEIKWSLIIKELNALEKHPREKVWLADSLLNLPIAGSLADSELSFGRFSTKNMNNFLMSASLE